LRGHGESQWPSPPAYSCQDYAGDLEQVIAELNLAPVVLVAHSMAVYHSIRCAVSSPEIVSRVVLIDIEAAARDEHIRLLRGGGSKPEPLYESLDQVVERERRFFPFAQEEALRAFIATNLREVQTGENSGGAAKPALTYRYDRATLALFEAYDEWSRLKQLQCPTLFVYGAHSPTARPEIIKKMVEAVPGSRAVKIDSAGHMLHLENPAGFAEAVTPFCLGQTA
jgi:pimeloyl-ACP methyl ester carboxylesterase